MAESKQSTHDIPPDDSILHLQVIDRVKNIPTVHSAMEKAGSTYCSLKESHPLIDWALTQTETGVQCAIATAADLSAPLVKKYEEQITAVDKKLCEGLNVVERNVPIVNEPPAQIYEAAKAVLSSSLQPTIDKLHATKESATQQASTLKEISVTKANELLNTQYGNMAVQGVDSTSALFNALLDRYFPPVEGEETLPAPVSADEDKVLHAVQTIGQLSTKTAKRVYYSIAAQLKTLKKEEILAYLNNVVFIIGVVNFLMKQMRKDKYSFTE